MKLLHTADWHFGKQLYGYSLAEEMNLFTDWLLQLISEEDVDILMISGDIFDLSNPANSDKERYFSFLRKVRELDIVTIITGGNHDSVTLLNAAKNYLSKDNIYVVGGATENLEEEIFYFDLGGEEVVICAVPFLRDRDLRNLETEEQFSSRDAAIKARMRRHYQDVYALAEARYPNMPIIAMGHLFAMGSMTSDSERDIHVGNSGAVSSDYFSQFDYVALGHIHKPQIIQGNEMLRYSGSPIPLSFSEKVDDKQVVIIEIANGEVLQPEVRFVPKFRDLLLFSGRFSTVKTNLEHLLSEKALPTFVELDIQEEKNSQEMIRLVNSFIDEFNKENDAQIINHKISFEEGSKNINELFPDGTSIENLTEKEVFKKRIMSQIPDCSEEEMVELLETFDELMDRYYTD